jgi:lia operon protein LiaG
MEWRGLVFLAGTLVGSSAAAQNIERHVLSGSDLAVYNLAGVARIEAGTGSDVVIELTRGGGDASRLTIAKGPIRGRETLRVIYPGDDVSYRPETTGDGRGHWGNSNTELRVRDDGTFFDEEEHRGERGNWFREGRRVRVSTRGGGMDAHADLRITLPAGKRFALYLAVGRVTVTNVNGDLRVDVGSADITADGTKGKLYLDTGSGEIRVTNAQGDVTLDTGSGVIRVAGVTGTSLVLDTGSGSVTAERVTVDALKVDTGSGNVELTGIRARDVLVDTGSGGVELELTGDIESLLVDTGSGGVTLRIPQTLGAEIDIETGSGGIDMNFPVQLTRVARDHIQGKIGDGRGTIRIDTGSGGIRLIRME